RRDRTRQYEDLLAHADHRAQPHPAAPDQGIHGHVRPVTVRDADMYVRIARIADRAFAAAEQRCTRGDGQSAGENCVPEDLQHATSPTAGNGAPGAPPGTPRSHPGSGRDKKRARGRTGAEAERLAQADAVASVPAGAPEATRPERDVDLAVWACPGVRRRLRACRRGGAGEVRSISHGS